MQFSLRNFVLATTAIGTFVGALTAEPIALAWMCYLLLCVLLTILLIDPWLPLIQRRYGSPKSARIRFMLFFGWGIFFNLQAFLFIGHGDLFWNSVLTPRERAILKFYNYGLASLLVISLVVILCLRRYNQFRTFEANGTLTPRSMVNDGLMRFQAIGWPTCYLLGILFF